MKLSSICANFVTKHRIPNDLLKSTKPDFQSINKNSFIIQCFILKCSFACINRNFHSILSLKAEINQEKGNEYLHNNMENLPSSAGKVIKNFAGMSSPQSSSKIDNKFSQEEAPRHLLFTYGTLKRGEPNHDIMQDTKNGSAIYRGVGRTVQKWPLVIASRYNIPFLLHCAGKGEQVIGELYEVDDKMLKFMDEFESHPKYYTRLKEEVQPEDPAAPPVRPWTYFFCNYKEDLLRLPYMADYHSAGPHGLPYVESEDTCDPEDIYR